ncbi:MAG: SET domain-containing protein-lysine N-methyltransferase [Bacteroidota bacterium]
MALLEKWLFIKRSSLPKAGLGLYTKKFIPKGAFIAEYKGKIRTWKEVNFLHCDNRYIFYVNRNKVIDALGYKKSFARYTNDAEGLKKIKGITNNADFIDDNGRIYIEATKDILPGQEIFVSYGKEYWKTIKQNGEL